MKVAVITGGSRGLGRALTKALLKRDWSVIVDGRDQAALEQLQLEAANENLTVVPGDVVDPKHRLDLHAEVERQGRLDVVINNASVLGPSPQPHLEVYPLDVLQQVYEINVVAPLALLQEFLPLLRRSHGVVINVTSDAAIEGYEGWGGYGSSKAALEQLTRVLAAEEPDLSVYWVDPGDMNTQMQQEAFPGEDVSDRPLPETSVPGFLHLIEMRPPSGRYQARALP